MTNIDNYELNIVALDNPHLLPIAHEELFAPAQGLEPPLTHRLPLMHSRETQAAGVGDDQAAIEQNTPKGVGRKKARLKRGAATTHQADAKKADTSQEKQEELTPEDQALIDMLDLLMCKKSRDWNVSDRDLPTARSKSLRVINEANRGRPHDPILYRYGGQLASLERNEKGNLTIVMLEKVRLRHLLSLLITFYRLVKRDDEIVTVNDMAPSWLCEDVLIAPNPALPVLEGVIAVPIFAKEGKLLTEPGYCPVSRLFCDPPDDLAVPEVPLVPTADQVAWAKHMIVAELLGDFPFVGPAELANAVALFLLPFVRSLINGPTPLHQVEKPTPGTGGSLMVEAMTQVSEGQPAAGMTAPASDEEMDKRLLAQFKSGARTIVLDNVSRKLDSASLAMALTSTEYKGRVLGLSTILSVKVGCTWIATANNPHLSKEMSRRTIRIRLDARVEEPWLRSKGAFRHPHLLEWVGQNRGSLVCAALILGQAWIVAGRPSAPDNPTLGMFENWSETLGGILHVAGIPGFMTNLNSLYATADDESATLRTFIAAWWHAHGQTEKRISDLFAIAEGIEPPLALGDKTERSQKIRLGQIVSAQRDRVFKVVLNEAQAAQWHCERLDIRVTSAGTVQNAQVWRLEPVL